MVDNHKERKFGRLMLHLEINDFEEGNRMGKDIYKPIYHFVPEKNWMNDPNGTIFYKGEYHLFYQHNPNAPEWGTIHWGHAKSKDLVHWEHLLIALYPSNELGEDHCFFGCAVISSEGIPTIFYTSIGTESRHQSIGAEQWMAISRDDMLTWEKSGLNPVMKLELHGDMDIREWRDPFVWKEAGVWYMLIGGGHNGKGCALIYKSDNLTDWTFLNKCLEGSEEYWECPNLFQLGDKKVLVYSPDDKVKYAIGNRQLK
jgi:beta-fructofuranosidase